MFLKIVAPATVRPPMKPLGPSFAVLALLASAATADPKKPPARPTGAIKGTVIFVGEVPDRTPVKRDTDPYCARTPKLSDDVVVTKGKLKDVLVRIKSGKVPAQTAPTAPVLIDQRQCTYAPRVVGMVVGQRLAVRNSDGTFHNVRGNIAGRLLWNNPQPAKDPDLLLDTSAKAGEVVDVQCDVHPWMHSYAVVMDHGYFAVTGEDGAFEITGLPPGAYTLEAWHPTLGRRTLDLKIGSGAKAIVTARITYKADER